MEQQRLIVTVSRENGSGGRYIAEQLSQRLGIRFYDKELLEGTAQLSGYSPEMLQRMDEKPRNLFTSRRVGEYSTSMEEHAARKVFAFIQDSAKAGDSFVVLGRCADYILRGTPGLLRIFVGADEEDRIKRIMERVGVSAGKAVKYIKDTDRKRRTYHDYYCDTRWGEREAYDLMVNSAALGLDRTVDALFAYIQVFQGNEREE